jgi:sulfofructosephosphate aldolase
VKLLLFFHPDGKTAGEHIKLTQDVFGQCQAQGLPFFLEILNYPLGGTPYDPTDLVPRSVQMFLAAKIAADVFKLEYPGSAQACAQVTSLLGNTPWILLTKGEAYDTFKEGLTIATANGARGFLAGRSIWQDFVTVPSEQWPEFFETTVKKRFQEISRISVGS